MSVWKLTIAIVLLVIGLVAILYCANMTAFSVWLSGHPDSDNQLWARRANIWALVTLAVLLSEVAGTWRLIVVCPRGRASAPPA